MQIVYIDVDSLRPDHVGAYGYGAPTTPNIDSFAEHAVRFERAYTANSPCLPSRAAFLSGRYGVNNGVATHGPPARSLWSPYEDRTLSTAVSDKLVPVDGTLYRGDLRLIEEDTADGERLSDWWTLPEIFFHNRVQTCAISSFPRHPAPWFFQHWHQFRQPQEPTGPDEDFYTVRAEQVVDLGLSFLNDFAADEFFLYLQFWDPHGPYNRTEEEVAKFDDVRLPPYPTDEDIEADQESDAWPSASDMSIADRDDLADFIAKYDAEIRYMDRHVGRVLDWLRSEDIFEDALVVVTADHGEEFGEHGFYRNHWSTFDGTQRVPLLVKPPASTTVDPGLREQLVTNVDIAPTLIDYADFDAPNRWQGQSLRPLLADADTEWRDFVVLDTGTDVIQRAVRTDQWKFIKTYHGGIMGDSIPEAQLYNMQTDSWEQENVAEANHDVVAELEERMLRWVERHRGPEEDALRAAARHGPMYYPVVKGTKDIE